MIVSCPSCGTNYKRPAAAAAVRARCGCCAGTIELTGLRPYRIVPVDAPSPEDLARAGSHLPIGYDEPALARRIAARAADGKPAPLVPLLSTPQMWDETESLPEIPEMSSSAPEFARSDDGLGEAEDAIAEASPREGSPLTVYGMWAVGGALVGTGTSWTLGGTTAEGLLAGGVCGLVAAWSWLRWASRP